LQIESTYGADQGCIISDDIRRTTGMNLRDREYGSIQRIAIATDDGLPALGYLHCSHHRIKPLVRLSGMTTFAFDDDFNFVARCHHGAGSHAELSGLHAGPIGHAEYGIHRKAFKQTVIHHALGTATAFFCRLEYQIDRAVEIA